MLSENYYSLADKDMAKYYLEEISLDSEDKIKVIPDFFKSFIQEYRNKLGISRREDDMVKKITPEK